MDNKKIKLQIKNRYTGSVLFEYESENNTIKETLLQALKSGSDLRGSDLRGSNLRGSDLRGSDLRGSDLSDSNLSGSNLSGSNLSGSDLRASDLRRSDLLPIKQDFFDVLLHGLPEIAFLKKNLIEGKIDGSTYDGECACLSGTLYNGATANNGEKETLIKQNILNCRDSFRPIERFFLAINKGDTPQTNQFSKLALEWLEEFEQLIYVKELATS